MVQIKFQGPAADLIYLFNKLHEEGFIAEESFQNRYEVIRHCFVDSDGKPFKKSLLKRCELYQIVDSIPGEES